MADPTTIPFVGVDVRHINVVQNLYAGTAPLFGLALLQFEIADVDAGPTAVRPSSTFGFTRPQLEALIKLLQELLPHVPEQPSSLEDR